VARAPPPQQPSGLPVGMSSASALIQINKGRGAAARAQAESAKAPKVQPPPGIGPGQGLKAFTKPPPEIAKSKRMAANIPGRQATPHPGFSLQALRGTGAPTANRSSSASPASIDGDVRFFVYVSKYICF
jgi:hypothetical protein